MVVVGMTTQANEAGPGQVGPRDEIAGRPQAGRGRSWDHVAARLPPKLKKGRPDEERPEV